MFSNEVIIECLRGLDRTKNILSNWKRKRFLVDLNYLVSYRGFKRVTSFDCGIKPTLFAIKTARDSGPPECKFKRMLKSSDYISNLCESDEISKDEYKFLTKLSIIKKEFDSNRKEVEEEISGFKGNDKRRLTRYQKEEIRSGTKKILRNNNAEELITFHLGEKLVTNVEKDLTKGVSAEVLKAEKQRTYGILPKEGISYKEALKFNITEKTEKVLNWEKNFINPVREKHIKDGFKTIKEFVKETRLRLIRKKERNYLTNKNKELKRISDEIRSRTHKDMSRKQAEKLNKAESKFLSNKFSVLYELEEKLDKETPDQISNFINDYELSEFKLFNENKKKNDKKIRDKARVDKILSEENEFTLGNKMDGDLSKALVVKCGKKMKEHTNQNLKPKVYEFNQKIGRKKSEREKSNSNKFKLYQRVKWLRNFLKGVKVKKVPDMYKVNLSVNGIIIGLIRKTEVISRSIFLRVKTIADKTMVLPKNETIIKEIKESEQKDLMISEEEQEILWSVDQVVDDFISVAEIRMSITEKLV